MEESLLAGANVENATEGEGVQTQDPTVKEGEGGKVVNIPAGQQDEPKSFDFSKASLDMFPEQFRKAANPIEAIVKSYTDMRNQFNKTNQDVPQDGKYEPVLDKELADLGIKVDSNRPEYKALLKVAQENKIGKSVFNKYVNDFIRNELANAPKKDEELKKLGDNANQIINTIAKRGAEILGKDSEEFKVLSSLVTTAEEARVIGKLLGAVADSKREPSVPLGEGAHDGGAGITEADVRARMADKRMATDPKFQQETLKLAEQIFKKR